MKRKKQSGNTDALIHSFGLAMIYYLKDNRNFQLVMLKEYEIYNPYLYPMMIKDNENINVLSKAFRYINSDSLHAFENFINSIDLN